MRHGFVLSRQAPVLLGLLLIASSSCENDVGAPSRRHLDRGPSYSVEGCWPISAECQDEPLSDTDAGRVFLAINGIDEWGDPDCGLIMEQLRIDFDAGRIRNWIDGPPEYHPDNYRGDRHNGPSVTHVTALSLGSDAELQRTLIHEGAHAFGLTDAQAEALEVKCSTIE